MWVSSKGVGLVQNLGTKLKVVHHQKLLHHKDLVKYDKLVLQTVVMTKTNTLIMDLWWVFHNQVLKKL